MILTISSFVISRISFFKVCLQVILTTEFLVSQALVSY